MFDFRGAFAFLGVGIHVLPWRLDGRRDLRRGRWPGRGSGRGMAVGGGVGTMSGFEAEAGVTSNGRGTTLWVQGLSEV